MDFVSSMAWYLAGMVPASIVSGSEPVRYCSMDRVKGFEGDEIYLPNQEGWLEECDASCPCQQTENRRFRLYSPLSGCGQRAIPRPGVITLVRLQLRYVEHEQDYLHRSYLKHHCQISHVLPLRGSTHPLQNTQTPQIVDKYVASPHRADGVRTARTD